jgi:hypothetical protein
MNNRSAIVSVATVFLASVAIGYTYAQTPPKPANPAQAEKDEEANETPIKLSDAPAPVKTAIAKLTPEKDIKKIVKESDEGVTIFEVEYQTDGKAHSADLSEAGDILALEAEVKADALPQAVSKAVTKAFPNSTIKSAESLQEFYYEVVVMADGKPHHVKVNATGEIQGKNQERDEDGEKD